MKHSSLPLLLFVFALLASIFACASYDMEIHGVAMQHYQPVDVPKVLDQVMHQQRGNGLLVAGVEVVDITPYDRKVWIAGFGPGRKSRGVLDPVTARILYLDDGNEAIVFVVMDLIGMMNPEVNRLRALITADHPRRVQVICTHNHQGPDPMGYWGYGLVIPLDNGVDQDWLAKSFQAIALGVNKAIENAKPVKIAFGEGVVEGKWSTNLWFEHDQGPIDKRMSVMRLETADGKAMATVINWACHAESLMENKKISADFPGRFYKANQQRGGGVGILLPGALGGMITAYPCRWEQRKHYNLEQRIAWADKLGAKLADVATKAVAGQPRSDKAPLHLLTNDVVVPMENAIFRVAIDHGLITTDDRDHDTRSFHSEVSLLDIGPATFAFMPGEAFPSMGNLLKKEMDWAKPPFVVSLTNDELAYMMMPEEWEDDHYGYERSMSCGRNTGRIIIDGLRELFNRRN